MSAFNNNNTLLNQTSAGIENRGSTLNSRLPDHTHDSRSGSPAHNIESAYQREQPVQAADLNPGNNLNDTYNRYQTGQPGNHGIATTGLNAAGLNATSGLNESHTHAPIASTQGNNNLASTQGNNNLNYSGADVNGNNLDQHRVGQEHSAGGVHNNASTGLNDTHRATGGLSTGTNDKLNYSGADVNGDRLTQDHLNTTRTGGAHNTAEDIRHNQAQEAIAHADHQHSINNNDSTRLNSDKPAHTSKVHPTASLGDHGASHHNKNNGGIGKTEKEHLDHEHGDDKVSAGDKIKGNLEKLVGKITGNEEKVLKGERLAEGHSA